MIQDINCVHKNCSQETSVKTKARHRPSDAIELNLSEHHRT